MNNRSRLLVSFVSHFRAQFAILSLTLHSQVVILRLGFIISPLAWLTYETYAYRRKLQTTPEISEDGRGGPFLREGRAKTDALATQMQLQQPPSMAAELSKPFGRMRRGRGEQSYERTYSESSDSDGLNFNARGEVQGEAKE